MATIFVGSASLCRAEPFVLPPPRDAHPAQLAGELRGDLVFPLHTRPLCPEGAACVMGNGAGIGLTGWWRWPRGSAIGFGYDLWLLDGNGVYELSSVHCLRASFREHFLRNRMAHPFVGVSAGVVLLGDTFQADGAGGALDLVGGVEVEITALLAVTVALEVRLLSTSTFVSESDGVTHSDRFGVNVVTALQVGILLLPSP